MRPTEWEFVFLFVLLVGLFTATMVHHHRVNSDPVVQQVTKEALEWKATKSF